MLYLKLFQEVQSIEKKGMRQIPEVSQESLFTEEL